MASAIQNTNNWQLAMRTLSDSATFLFNNKTMSDITFVFEKNNLDNSLPEIHAHSWILSMLSPVFYNSFKDNFEVSKQIPVSDTSYQSFLECLRFVYRSECILTQENVYDVLKIAKKYSLHFLEEDCSEYIIKSVTIESVCLLLDNSISTKQNTVQDKLIEFIAPKIVSVLQTKSFLNIKKESLDAILSIEKMGPITEVEIFKGAMKWAQQKCISSKIVLNGSNKRQQLSELVKKIPFHTMNFDELRNCFIQEKGLLTIEEEHSFLMSARKNINNNLRFRSDARNYLIDLEKIIEYPIQVFKTNKGRYRKYVVRTKFSVNKMIYLTGVKTVYSSETQNVKIQFITPGNNIWYEEKFERGGNNIFPINRFTKPLLLNSNQEYIVDVIFDNTNSVFMYPEKVTVPWSTEKKGVQFNFSELSQLLFMFLFKA